MEAFNRQLVDLSMGLATQWMRMLRRHPMIAIVQRLTFLVAGLAFLLGVAFMHAVPNAADEPGIVEADSETFGDTGGDSLEAEDDALDCLHTDTQLLLHPGRSRHLESVPHEQDVAPHPALDPLLRPPCSHA